MVLIELYFKVQLADDPVPNKHVSWVDKHSEKDVWMKHHVEACYQIEINKN